jgi:replicative DNA helicase
VTLDTIAGRQVPFDETAEQQVLGSLLIDRDAIFKVADSLGAADFYVARHQRIFATVYELLQRRERIDPLTVQVELARKEELDRVGGPAYLKELVDRVATAVEIERHARVVRDKAILRRLLGAATQIAADAYAEPTDMPLALDRSEQRIFALRDDTTNAQLRHIQTALQDNFQLLTERMDRPYEVSGIPSGFRELDFYTEGFTQGDFVVLAARPSVGKTSLGLAMAFNMAKRGHPTLVFTLEMDAKQIVSRLLAMNSRRDLLALRTGNVFDTEAASALAGVPILIDDTPGLSIMELRTKARRATTHDRLEVIIVDYVQLMRTGENEENRVQEIATITRNLKSLARELNVVVIGLSQLSRAAGDAGLEPKLSTLRECVTGDTIVCLADGRRIPIRELVGTTPEVLSVRDGRIVKAKSDLVWSVGTRPVFRVRLASGREIRATADHRLHAFGEWKRISELRVGDRLAIARRVPGPDRPSRWPLANVVANTNVDTLPREVFEKIRLRMRERGMTTLAMAALRGTSYGGSSHFKFAPSRSMPVGYAQLLDDDELRDIATSDLFWDRIIAIEPAGEEEVFDLTVPGPSSWLADGIVSHNSGALEQDADIVVMLWKDKEDTPPGAPRLIHGSVAKNRNGPTGIFTLLFASEQARFFSKTTDEQMPV